MLVGRSSELARIDQLLRDARELRAGILAIVGGPGSGKSSICREVADRAVGFRVHTATAAEAESQLPLAVASDLTRVLHDPGRPISPYAEATLAALQGWTPAVAADRLALGVATLALHSSASENGPLVIVIDDAHWVDQASLDALCFAWRRLDHDPIAIVVATRPPAPSAIAAFAELILLDGLPVDAGIELVRANAPHPVADHVARDLVTLTLGNPLALKEIPRELTRDQLAGHASLPSHLPRTYRVTSSFGAAIRSLPPASRQALAVVAAAGIGAAEYVPAALMSLGLKVDDLSPAADADLCQLRDGGIEIRHPVIAAVALSTVGDADLRRIYASLAEATQHTDPVRSALHMADAAAGPSEPGAAALCSAADLLRAQGGPVASAPLLARAARLTPPGDRRTGRLLDATLEALLGGHLELVVELCCQVRSESNSPAVIADTVIFEGQAALWRGAPNRVIDDLRALSRDPVYEAVALQTLMPLLTNRGDLAGLATEMQRLRALVGDGDPSVALMADLTDAVLGVRHTDSILAAADRLQRDPPTDRAGLNLLSYIGLSCAYVEHHSRALAIATELINTIRSAGAPSDLPFVLTLAGYAEWWIGDWQRSRSHLDEAIQLADDTGQPTMAGLAHGLYACIAAAQGDPDQTGRHVAEAVRCAETFDMLPCAAYAQHAVGHLAFGRGDFRAALEPLRRAGSMLETESGPCNPILVPNAGDLIETLIHTRHLDQARAQLEQLERQTDEHPSPWANMVARRCRALLPQSDWYTAFREALNIRGDGLAYERARVHQSFGERLRRERRNAEAIDQLEQAHAQFSRLGARTWIERAADELRALGIGVRPQSSSLDALTPQELRVCLTVAQGSSNRETADALFLSTKTIETHLSRAFRKLNVTSRVQLARVLAETGPNH